MTMTPYFSIIVPVYRAEPYLRQCVDSILGQTFPDFELILVDDGSPDGSPALCDEYARKDGRVAALHQPNAGPTAARRNGLDRAQGEYVCFVDSDDWVVPHWLETVKDHIDENGGPDMVIFDYDRDSGQPEQPVLAAEGYYDRARLEAEIYPWMLCDVRRRPFGTQLFPGHLCTKAFRRELVCAHFIADERITVFEDAAMLYECVYHARSVYISRQRLYIYRRVEQSNLCHYRPDYFQELKMGLDYMTASIGGISPVLDRQISGFYVRKIIVGILQAYGQHSSVRAAARDLRRGLRDTGLMGGISSQGLPGFIRLYVWMLKCRLFLPAALVTVMRMEPEEQPHRPGQ